MGYVFYNPNPAGKFVGDCVIRALCKTLNKSWETIYTEVALTGFHLCDMPSSNYVWGYYLKQNGFVRKNLPDTCPDCYTLNDFCNDYPNGQYIVATGTHVCAVCDGSVYDSWDSRDEIVTYYYVKEMDDNG